LWQIRVVGFQLSLFYGRAIDFWKILTDILPVLRGVRNFIAMILLVAANVWGRRAD